ncbi:MAG: hypothetical protein A3G24_00690 [Betaproteobacteria bacterium RIFCSPLOWO2_12_FULL_62_13]|nr:MAG: hypothetical protein A3G24_00690 [Betaproteobacteria bacterium RIFCSPLOWO2_12_FULL_62_13]
MKDKGGRIKAEGSRQKESDTSLPHLLSSLLKFPAFVIESFDGSKWRRSASRVSAGVSAAMRFSSSTSQSKVRPQNR